MKTTDLFNRRSTARRLMALLGTLALCLGIVAATPVAPASNAASGRPAAGADRETDESKATREDVASGAVRTKPDKAKRGDEVEQAANPSQTPPKKEKEVPAASQDDDIVGGTVAAPGAYPFFVAVKTTGGFAFCGGTLVSSIWVLTAAHCVDGGTTPASLKLVIGAWQLNNEAPGDVRSVTAIHIHPSWNPATFDNDVALLRLNTASTKAWARLAEPVDPVAPGNTVRAIGHGHTTQGGVASNDLRQVDLPIQSDATMSAPAQYGGSFHGAVMIGAGPLAGGMDTCQGDSGGPLFVAGGQVRLVGDTSWGSGCAQPNKPGIYGEVYQGALRTFVNGLVGRPANDNFAGSGIAGADGTVSGSNTDATGQTGEPAIAGSPADTTVWYSWTAPESGPTSFNTRDAAFDTTLNVFTGSTFGTLASVASNDDFNGTLQSKVTFNATAGTTYRIAVDGFSAAHGSFSLQYAQNSPANDNFASPAVITGATGKTSANTARSTGEPGEPNHGSIPDRSVWYSWTAPETGTAVAHTRESNFDTVIAAYTGTTITGLTQLASNDQFNGTNQSKITFPVTAGTTYRIAVDGFGATTGALGMQWSINPPANDNFSSPQVLPGQYGSISSTSVRATGEPGELDFHGGAAADGSVWYLWTPTVTAPASVTLSNPSSGFAPGVEVYTGTSLGALTSVLDGGSTGGSFNVTAGTPYRIAVDGNSGTTGTFDLAWAALTLPGKPTVTSSTPSAGAVTVAFNPPANTGGSAISNYQASCVSTNGGLTKSANGAASPVQVTLLTAGKNYHCRVRATNGTGTGLFSAYGAIVTTPTTAPAPTVTSTTPAAAGQVTVAFSPNGNGGSPITNFTVLCNSTNGGVNKSKTGPASPLTVTALTPGRLYHCRVRANNAVGAGSYGAFGATVMAAVAPASPTVTSSTPAAGRVTVAFTAGATGGSPITGFTAACLSTDGGVTKTRTGPASPLSVLNLTSGKHYHCRVRATNAAGSSPYGAFGTTVLVP